MEDQNLKNNQNKTPSRMARLAWPKAKYGLYTCNNNYSSGKSNLL